MSVMPGNSGRVGNMNTMKTAEPVVQLRCAGTIKQLAEIVYEGIRHYPFYHFQKVRLVIDDPKIIEQVFSTYNTLLRMQRENGLALTDRPLEPCFAEYCEMVEMKIRAQQDPEQQQVEMIYYLLLAFNLFVLRQPVHPAGTPLPGGLDVKFRNGRWYCPVKDKTALIKDTLCYYCCALPLILPYFMGSIC
jgi:uncharacterized protein (UPF0305 family)